MTEPRIGVIGIPGKWSTEVLADNLERRTGFRLVVDMADVVLRAGESTSLTVGDFDLCDLDGLIVKKISQQYSPASLDRLELLRIAEGAGVRVFSPAESMIRLIDRLACTTTLLNAGLPMPATCITEQVEDALDAVLSYGNAILKPLYSTKARGMLVLESVEGVDALREQIRAFHHSHPVIYVQKRITRLERDMGLAFLGGQYLGAYARVSGKTAWNTTIRSGGKYQPCKPSDAIIELAERAQALFNLDFTTVDIAETDEGPVVFEVSAFGGFKGALEGAGVNVAQEYAQYAINQVQS